MSTPWGEVQHIDSITNGVDFVHTVGHGGLRISKEFAQKNLSNAAIKRGMQIGSYLYYEEDCAWCIPVFELEEYHDKFYKEDAKQKLLQSLSMWNLDYLEERGIESSERAANEYRLNQKRDELRKEKHPNFIVAATLTSEPGVTKVWTADDKEYLVKSDSYQYTKHELNLLSHCVVIKELV